MLKLGPILLLFLSIGARSDEPSAGHRATAIKTAKNLYQKRDFQAAIDVLSGVIRQKPNDAEAEQILALAYYSIGNVARAVPLLEALQANTGPSGFDTSYLLGMCYLKIGQPDKARPAFARMYSVLPDSAAAHLFFARILVREHHEEEAIPELEKAISLDNRIGMAHFLLGEVYLYKQAAQSAITEFRKELEISPALWLVYWRLADALLRIEAYDDAERAAKQAIWLNESFSGSYVTLGQIALKRGDLELAQGLLERAVKMEPGNHNAHYSLARTYQRLGRTDDAARQFEVSRSLLGEKNSGPSVMQMR